MVEKKLTAISASRLKLFKSCSYQYFCRYVLRLPDKTNAGALMGLECHTIAECLLNPRHRKLFDNLIASQSVYDCPQIKRHISYYVKKNKLDDNHTKKIGEMLIVALNTDFFCKGNHKIDPELAFDIVNEKPKYRILGFIDKIAHYVNDYIRIVDYKSSKQKFAGDELTVNVQAMMYSLAAKHLYPKCKPIADFLFLQFPDNPIQRIRFTDEQLKGFEYYLSSIQKKIDSFTLKDAKSNYAADQPYPSPQDGFCGPLMCGRAKFQGELKKDGTPKFHCLFKFPFNYFALCNENGDTLKTSFVNNFVPKEESGEFVIEKKFSGCPRYNR